MATVDSSLHSSCAIACVRWPLVGPALAVLICVHEVGQASRPPRTTGVVPVKTTHEPATSTSFQNFLWELTSGDLGALE